MSEIINNVRISLRKDFLSNWISCDPVLKNGEIAIATDAEGNEALKIGNGVSSFSQLDFLNQKIIKSDTVQAKDVTAKSIEQGYSVNASQTSLATGIFSDATGNFCVAHGIEASAAEDYSFVWNGANLAKVSDRYSSHGEGTFSVNPLSGLSGFYIGENTLAREFENKTSSFVRLSSETTQNLSTNLDMVGFLRVGGITVQGRKFIEIAKSLIPVSEQSPTRIGQAYLMISTDFSNSYIQGHTYLLTTDISGNMEYKDITDLNEMSVTYVSSAQDLRFDSHVGSVRYDSSSKDLELQILRM